MTNTWDEDRITADLYTEIIFAWRDEPKASCTHNLAPHSQFPLYPKENKAGSPRKIDFVFRKGYEEQVYFAFECKIVDHNNGNLTYKYVKLGMRRYIEGNYASKMPAGGMIGYMFNDQITPTVDTINSQILSQVGMSANDYLNKGSIQIDGFGDVFISNHIRTKDCTHFMIYHLFFPF